MGVESREDFYEQVSTLEEDVTVSISASDSMEGVDQAGLLQVGAEGDDYTCIYMSDEQLVELCAAINRYLGTPR